MPQISQSTPTQQQYHDQKHERERRFGITELETRNAGTSAKTAEGEGQNGRRAESVLVQIAGRQTIVDKNRDGSKVDKKIPRILVAIGRDGVSSNVRRKNAPSPMDTRLGNALIKQARAKGHMVTSIDEYMTSKVCPPPDALCTDAGPSRISTIDRQLCRDT